jgi:drug/metabolite transporter (DMT)-like permease
LILRKKPDKYNVIAGIVCLAGVGFICLQSDFSIGLGDALTLVCGFLYAIHIVVCGAAVGERSPILLSMVQFVVAGILAAILAVIFEPFPTHVPPATIGVLAFLTVFSTALCLSLQIFGQKHTPTSQAAVIMAFEAVLGAAASVIMTGEILSFKLFCGFVLMFAAVIVSETKLSFLRKKRVQEETPNEILPQGAAVQPADTAGACQYHADGGGGAP